MTIQQAIETIIQFVHEELEFGITYDDMWAYHGAIDYKNKHITLNVSHDDDKITLMTLAHELGHYQHYEEAVDDCPPAVIREAYAMSYGWELIEDNGFDKFISATDWLEFHDEMHLYFLRDY